MFNLDNPLVSPKWLSQHEDDPNLRIFDCTVFLGYDPERGIISRPGLPEYESAHIPKAAFLDLYHDLSVVENGVEYMRPSPEQFGRVMSRAGLGDDHQAVLYSSSSTVYWATRFWWMLRANGFTRAVVLDGGLQRWVAEGYRTASGQETYPMATFTSRLNPDCWVDKGEVLANIGNPKVCTINMLSRDEYLGIREQNPFEKEAYGRKGRIVGSLNLPYEDLLTDEGVYLDPDRIRKAFKDVGAFNYDQIILHCGAGLGSTMGALALHQIGYDRVAIYDGSMHEWGRDETLPMEVG